MKEFEEIYCYKGKGVFIHYDNDDETECTIDINGSWVHIKAKFVNNRKSLIRFKHVFEKWYLKQLRHKRVDYNKFTDLQLMDKFERKQLNEKWGVYVDFSIHINYPISVHQNCEEGYLSSCFDIPIDVFLDINNARRSAISFLINRIDD